MTGSTVGTDPPHDAAHWDERYAVPGREPFTSPEPSLAELLAHHAIAPGRALDLGAGEGRHAAWLAQEGWRVTAIDFSRTGIERARTLAGPLADAIDWVVGDVTTWQPDTTYDLVLGSFIRLEPDVLARVRDWVAPGGHLVLLSHGEATEPGGGPRNPRFRTTVAAMRERAGDLEVLVCDEVPSSDDDRSRHPRIRLLARKS